MTGLGQILSLLRYRMPERVTVLATHDQQLVDALVSGQSETAGKLITVTLGPEATALGGGEAR